MERSQGDIVSKMAHLMCNLYIEKRQKIRIKQPIMTTVSKLSHSKTSIVFLVN